LGKWFDYKSCSFPFALEEGEESWVLVLKGQRAPRSKLDEGVSFWRYTSKNMDLLYKICRGPDWIDGELVNGPNFEA
jgi:hypothetical protein